MAASARVLVSLAFALAAAPPVFAQEWVTHPETRGESAQTPANLQFRTVFSLERAPRQLLIDVTADNRFILYVNGRRVAAGPARGDLSHWRNATLDIAPHLRAGENVVAAEVWNGGRFRPGAQISARTAFRLESRNARFDPMLETGQAGWQVRRREGRTVGSGLQQVIRAVGPTGYYVAGPPETLEGRAGDDAWRTAADAQGGWVPVQPAIEAGEASPWRLVADPLPQMRYDPAPVGTVVRARGIEPGAFPQSPITVPPNSEVELLIDSGRVMAAHPEFDISGGAGAVVEATYAEALYDAERQRLHDRTAVGDGRALGLTDTLKPAGDRQTLAPQWWRTWRFLQLRVRTGDAPLTLHGVSAYETGYPFETLARFESSDPELNEIWRIGWNTVRLDAHETYMDTAYWEQLQYIGDTRIQALVSYDVSGDPRLAEQAIDAFDASRVVDGLPQAAWPSSGTNSIPPFALLWIGMVHDYWMNQADDDVVRRNLDGVRAVLDWYAPYVRDTGLVRQTPGWLFIDWRPGMSEQPRRSDPRKPDSCIISMLYLGALLQAAGLEEAHGDAALAAADRTQADRVRAGIQAGCWDAERGLYADAPDHAAFSQHANILAVLYDVAPTEGQAALLDRVMTADGIDAPEGITGVTYYFAFYLARALEHAGVADRYPAMLRTWRSMLAQNFTTWPEAPDPSRSDSHAWSAHPTSDMLRLIAGVRPDAPGYVRVRVEPHLGALDRLDAAVAHPKGLIETRYEIERERMAVDIRLPRGVEGVFVHEGRERRLRSGRNRFTIAHPVED